MMMIWMIIGMIYAGIKSVILRKRNRRVNDYLLTLVYSDYNIELHCFSSELSEKEMLELGAKGIMESLGIKSEKWIRAHLSDLSRKKP